MARMVCRNCESEVEAKKRNEVTGGQIVIALLLLMLMILPGIIYIIWMSSKGGFECSACGSRDLVPVGSKAAARILEG